MFSMLFEFNDIVFIIISCWGFDNDFFYFYFCCYFCFYWILMFYFYFRFNGKIVFWLINIDKIIFIIIENDVISGCY